jgi:cell division GTPase FtsZ
MSEFDFIPPSMPTPSFEHKDENRFDEEVEAEDFGLMSDFGIMNEEVNEDLLADNYAPSSISIGFMGVGGAGNKIAAAFIAEGFTKTLLVNTTGKDIPDEIAEEHVVLIPNADGIGKNTRLGKSVLEGNSAVVEDALRTKLGKVDWLFVMAGGGGGTGSSVAALHEATQRYMKSVQAEGEVVYIVSWPTSQELLNPTIAKNALSLLNDVSEYPHIVIDNERQLRLLRSQVGMLGLYPKANTGLAKLLGQVLKLSTEASPIQSYDSKDLETCIGQSGRMFLGSTIIREPATPKLGSMILQNCLNVSACPPPKGKPKTGTLLLVVSEDMVNDPRLSKHLEAAVSYVGGRCETLFSGIYIRKSVPGLIAILTMSGLPQGR